MIDCISGVLSGARNWCVWCGDARVAVKNIPDNSLHSVVCDPPYFISFMSSAWDKMSKEQAALSDEFWAEVLRVLKPGGHVVAFGYPRTIHRLATAIEDAGFEIRDQLQWMYGQAMPKGVLNVGKLIDEKAGLQRPVVGTYRVGGNALTPTSEKGGTYGVGAPNSPPGSLSRTAPVSDAAHQWEDWAALLKIANEPIVLARKPFNCTLEQNVMAWGCGALNIGATRVKRDWADEPGRGESWAKSGHSAKPDEAKIAAPPGIGMQLHPGGAHPPNVLMDELVAGIVDDETGEWVSRYFPCLPAVYAPKASRKERDAGLEHWPPRKGGEATKRKDGSKGTKNGRAGAGRTGGSHNPHISVKPISVIRWLVRLVTPFGGIVADWFVGSGSTICAAVPDGFRVIGVELDCISAAAAYDRAVYWERVGHDEPVTVRPGKPKRETKKKQETLFT